jgi:TonB family protein
MQMTEDDYPPQSRRAEQQGVVDLFITVSPEGRVTACLV